MKIIDNTPIENFDTDWGDPDGTGMKEKSKEQVQKFIKKKFIGLGYTFLGKATPSTVPATITIEDKFLYIATEEGDYTNFGLGNISELSIIKSENGSWKIEGLGVVFFIKSDISNAFHITDNNGNVIATVDESGLSTTDLKIKDENGDLKSVKELSTPIESISELYDDTLYIADSKGNVICKLGDTGFEVVNIKTNALLRNQWNNKIIATYGDSITALNGGDFTAPYSSSATNKKWAGKVAEYFNFAKLHNRGIGSTTFNYYNEAGGQVAWVKSDTGEYVSRSDAYNYDNYQGNIEIPTDCTPIRGCGSSWLRIKTMFNESFKDTVDVVLVMFHNDFHQDMQTECVWVENSVKDIEWSESEYYSQYNGDYNIESVQGGIASVIMKMQAWMPQALIILMTPISGVYINGNDDVKDLENPESKKMKRLAEVVKDIAFRMSIPCIDVYGNDTINSLNKISRNYITDGIHPYSDAGAKVIARAIISKLISEIPNL